MKSSMTKTGHLLIGVWLLTTYSCNKQELSTTQPSQLSGTSTDLTAVSQVFNASVGAPVDFTTGMQWIENFKRTNDGLSKEYTLSGSGLKSMLNNISCVGICLYFAKDEQNNTHLLPIGINNQGKIMKAQYLNTSLGKIDWSTAQRWIANDLSPIDARFFGRNTFSRLFKDPECTHIKAIWALDQDNQSQILLIDAGINYAVTGGWNTNIQFEDRSSPCPPICGINEQ